MLGNIDRRRQNRSELAPVFTQAFPKAKEVLNNPDYAIQENDPAFVDLYGEAGVASDRAYVDRVRGRIEREQTTQDKNTEKVAQIFEAIMLIQAELSNWFGENARTFKTSDFDDLHNKVDMFTEWYSDAEGTRVLALGVDATTGPSGIPKKLMEIRDQIDAGILAQIKYFKDERGDFTGTRRNVPRVIVGAGIQTVQHLASLWIEGEKRQLGQHAIQRLIVNDQIIPQLRYMEKYALAHNQPVVASSYRQALAAIAPLEEEKRIYQLGDLVSDPVTAELHAQLNSLFRV